eukprot:7400397-Pyramimonas_sp.AAC.1
METRVQLCNPLLPIKWLQLYRNACKTEEQKGRSNHSPKAHGQGQLERHAKRAREQNICEKHSS